MLHTRVAPVISHNQVGVKLEKIFLYNNNNSSFCSYLTVLAGRQH